MNHPYKEHKECLISNSQILKPLAGYEKNFLVKSYPTGFVFCSRIPTENELLQLYNTYPAEHYLSPLTAKRYNELLEDFEKYRKTNKILDVGCGDGFFLIEAQKRGWEVYGTEFTNNAIEKCEKAGIKMKQGSLRSDWFENNSIDIVTSFEVMEHINNPKEEVTNIKNVLRKGGLFYFTTPNFNAIERFVLKDNYNVIFYPEHLCYYTKKTMNFLLIQHGFKRKRLDTTGISLTRLRTSFQKKRNKKVTEGFISSTSTDEQLRLTMESNVLAGFVKKVINAILSISGTGNSLKGFYEKL